MNKKHFNIDIETTVSHDKFKALRALDEKVAHIIMGCSPSDSVPPYSTSFDLSHKVEDEIEQRGHAYMYIHWLKREVSGKYDNDDMDSGDWFKVINATPEQRCRAAYKAVKGCI